MIFPVRAITLDLDDTLWPFAPIGARVERVLHDWLEANCPRTAARFPIERMRELRDELNAAHPQLVHDFSAMRRMTLDRAMRLAGDDPVHVEAAFEAFFAERNRVEFYPDALDALQRLAARVPLAALSNGNADLARIGVHDHFAFQLGAREHGAPKPDASIFLAACERLGAAPAQVLHVGDDIEMDVVGAARAGLRTCWLNRDNLEWPHADVRPDLHFASLTALADWLDALHSAHEDVAA
ncbi:HAD family hydrolase [Lysobacter solisilvae (ex Woo and Kim 2022)]|uniref:HAD-IA family hydrolase n=1 Tax=Agrilutibacter terrestris TaxID=2865112 RepID=A0A7H0FUK1_9GAMM|nr:HAD-IA family hydrolase [Lysobacter terrestris]QNP39717.1 HAD-IA family hydrolase [Lysobacter terrestris]